MKYLHLIKLRNKATGKTATTPLKVNGKPYVYEGSLSDALKCIVDSIKHFESTMLPMFDSEIVEFIVCDEAAELNAPQELTEENKQCANCNNKIMMLLSHPVLIGNNLFTHVCPECYSFEG